MASGGRTSYSFLIGTKVTGTQQVTKLGNSMQGVQGKAKNLALSMKGLATGLAAVAGAAASFRAISKSLEVFAGRQADVFSLSLGLSRLTSQAPQVTRELTKVADALGFETLFDERDFQKGFVLLTTFKNIAVDSYKEIGEAAADIAQASPTTSIDSAFMQLAKALQDPVRGMTALRRAGVDLQDQEEVIKRLVSQNKLLEAQKLILREVQGSYNNISKAAAKGLAGSFDTLAQSSRNLQEQFGKLLTPIAVPILNTISAGLQNLSQTIQGVTQALPEVIESMRLLLKVTLAWAGTMALMTVGKLMGKIIAAFKLLLDMEKLRLGITKAWVALQAAAAAPGGLWGKAALGVTVFAAINKVIDEAVDSTKEFYKELEKIAGITGGEGGGEGKGKGKGIFGGIKDGVTAYMDSIKTLAEGVSDIVQKSFKGLEDALVNFVKTGKLNFANLVDSILTDIARLTIQKTITGPLSTILSNALQGAFSSIGGNTSKTITDAATKGTSGVANQLNKQFGDGGYGTSGGTGMTYGRALGGSVVSGASYLVGEQGPEMFTPTGNGTITSNHDLVMDRYRSVGSSTKTNGTTEGGVSFSTGGASVIDLRYDVERINSVDYVTASQFQQGMSQAAREGARQGEASTLRRLQTSPSARRRVGV